MTDESTAEPSQTDILIAAADAAMARSGGTETRAAPPSIYTAATTEAARDIISRRDMLQAMIGEDDAELEYLDREFNDDMAELKRRQLTDIATMTTRHADHRGLVEARKADRLAAWNAFGTVIDKLQKGKKP